MALHKSLLFSLALAAGATACSHDASTPTTTPSSMDNTPGAPMTTSPTANPTLPSSANDPTMTSGPNQPGTSTGTMGSQSNAPNSQNPNTAAPNSPMPPPAAPAMPNH